MRALNWNTLVSIKTLRNAVEVLNFPRGQHFTTTISTASWCQPSDDGCILSQEIPGIAASWLGKLACQLASYGSLLRYCVAVSRTGHESKEKIPIWYNHDNTEFGPWAKYCQQLAHNFFEFEVVDLNYRKETCTGGMYVFKIKSTRQDKKKNRLKSLCNNIPYW